MGEFTRGVQMITNFPLPPSVNQLYRNVPRIGRVKTKAYQEYENACRIWMLSNQTQLWAARDIANMCGAGKVIFITTTFYFHRQRILTLDNRPKRCDTSNYLKAPFDMLAQMLHIGDEYFWAGKFEKFPVETKAEEKITFGLNIHDVY